MGMDNVSRPLIALLVGSVAFLALWLVALKPSSSSTTGNSGGLGQYQSAINKAHQAAATSNAASAAEGGTVATTATSTGAAARPQAAPRTVSHPVKVHVTPNTPAAVAHALATHKVVALLFYNPAATDDNAVRQELATVPTHAGKVVKMSVQVSRLARYSLVTNQVPVQVSPTLVLIDKQRQASTIVGFADRFEIAQRVADALG
jgi:hypothetical protein